MRSLSVTAMFLLLFVAAFTRSPVGPAPADKTGPDAPCAVEGPDLLPEEGTATFTATCGNCKGQNDGCWPGCDEARDEEPDYQFDWGDGTQSDWGEPSQTHAYDCSGGPYEVKARARCGQDVSDWSDPHDVACPSAPALGWSPATLTVLFPTTSVDIEVWNAGSGTLAWSVGEAAPYDWLSLSPTGGSSEGEHDAVTVSIDWGTIPAGETRSGNVEIASDGGDGTVAVTASRPAGPGPNPIPGYPPPDDRINPVAVRGWTNAQFQALGDARTAPAVRMALPATAQARYVSAARGNDGGDGSLASPWRTLQHAADVVAPNTTVYVDASADYTGGLRIERSGAENAWIVFTAADPQQPPRAVGGMNRDAVVEIDASWVVLAGFEVANHDRGSLSLDEIGIKIEPQDGDISHVWVAGNRIHDIGPPDAGSGNCYYNAHGIIARSEGRLISDLIIDGNELYELYVGNSECLVVNGLIEDFRITRNYVHDVNNIAIDVIGYEQNDHETASRGLVADNVVLDASNSWPYCTRGNCTYVVGAESGNGIYVDGGAELEIAYNAVGRTDLGLELQSENGQLIRDVLVHDNAVFNSNYVNFLLGPHQTVVVSDNEFFDEDALRDPLYESCH